MQRDTSRRRRRGPATTEYHPDPAALFGHQPPAQVQRKVMQLCRQVEERLGLVLAGEVEDPTLQDLYVVDVTPEPGGGRLVVRFARAPGTAETPLAVILPRLEALRPFLRGEIAAAIHRKRTPDLVFQVLQHAPEEVDA
jgi:ribosome-binding factor A